MNKTIEIIELTRNKNKPITFRLNDRLVRLWKDSFGRKNVKELENLMITKLISLGKI